MPLPQMTSKIGSSSPGSNLIFALPWCFCVRTLVRIHQICLQILSGYHLSHDLALNDLENKIKVTQFELGFHHALVLPCTKLGEDTSNSNFQIMSGNHLQYVVALNDLCDIENKFSVTLFELGLRLALVLLCKIFGEDTSIISSDIEWKPAVCRCANSPHDSLQGSWGNFPVRVKVFIDLAN